MDDDGAKNRPGDVGKSLSLVDNDAERSVAGFQSVCWFG